MNYSFSASFPSSLICSGRLVRKRSLSKGEPTEEGDEEEDMDIEMDPLSSLVKRPRRMHADREEDEERDGEIGRHGGREGGEQGGADLRGILKKKRKRRDLQMRLGTYPRLVEEHR